MENHCIKDNIRPPPKISLRHDLNWTRGNDDLGSTGEHRPVRKLVQQSLGETVHFGSSKPTQSPKTNEDRSGKPVAQEVVVGVLQEEPSSSDRPGRPVSREEQHVQNHDSSGKPEREEVQHTVQENYHLESRDTVDKFDLATDDANVDFSVSGIPEETVKRSKTLNILELIRRITRHPQKQAVQNDLDQKQSFNAFSAESKKAIKESGNIEISEIVNTEPKLQCKFCLNHCTPGIIYCVCGRLMAEDSAEHRKCMSSTLDLFSIPCFYIRKDRPRGHRYGKASGCKEYHMAHQLAKKCRKRGYESIHDRYIRDRMSSTILGPRPQSRSPSCRGLLVTNNLVPNDPFLRTRSILCHCQVFHCLCCCSCFCLCLGCDPCSFRCSCPAVAAALALALAYIHWICVFR